MPAATIRKNITLSPVRWRSSRLGSEAQARKVTTSCAICCTVAATPSFEDHRLIRRTGAVVCIACCLIIRERPGNRVGGPPRPLVHIALIVWLRIGDLIAGGDLLHLCFAVAEVCEITEIEVLDR